MMNFVWKKLNKKGFTLIELIVVIAILGILAAIAIPRLSGFTESAKQASDKEAAAVVANAGAMYLANHPTADDSDITVANLGTAGLLNTSEAVLHSTLYGGSAAGVAVPNPTITDGVVSVTIGSGSDAYTISK